MSRLIPLSLTFVRSVSVPVLVLMIAVLCCGAAFANAEDEATRNLLAAGDKAFIQRDYHGALSKFTEALMRQPRNERALFSRAELLSMMRQKEEALTDVNTLLKINPDHPQARALRITLNVHAVRLGAALADAKHLAGVYRKQKKAAKVREVEESVVKLERYAGRWESLSSALDLASASADAPAGTDAVLQRRYAECVFLLESVISDFARDSLDLRLRRASCALAVDNNQAAAAEIKYVLQRDTNNLRAIALNARSLRSLGALDQARSEVRRCLALDPEYAPCASLHKLIRVQVKMTKTVADCIESKRYTDALESIEAAMSQEPHSPYEEQLMIWRCEAYVGLRDPAHGVKACQSVIDRVGHESQTAFDMHLHLAELHLLNDDFDAAEQSAGRARELQPRSARVDDLLQKIEKLRRTGARKDYYKILGVRKTASSQEIHRAYRKLAKELHPDQLRSKELTDDERAQADKRFRDINEAKEMLLNDEVRARYDNGEDVANPHEQQQGSQPFHGHPFPFNFNGFPGFQGHHHGGGDGGQQQYFFFQRG